MIKMCMNLKDSQYRSIAEVESILNNEYVTISEQDIINMKDNRSEIDRKLKLIKDCEDIAELGI